MQFTDKQFQNSQEFFLKFLKLYSNASKEEKNIYLPMLKLQFEQKQKLY